MPAGHHSMLQKCYAPFKVKNRAWLLNDRACSSDPLKVLNCTTDTSSQLFQAHFLLRVTWKKRGNETACEHLCKSEEAKVWLVKVRTRDSCYVKQWVQLQPEQRKIHFEVRARGSATAGTT